MTATDTLPEAAPKRSRLPLFLGLALGLAGAGGGFMATRLGLLQISGATAENSVGQGEQGEGASSEASEGSLGGDDIANAATTFIPLDPMIVNVDDPTGRRFLRFAAQIEAEPGQAASLESIKPRFSDVLNGYLRAVSLSDLENPQALDLLRGQMLRRLQTVAGEGKIRDLLIIEFVLN
jgi:flagellar FliL protein